VTIPRAVGWKITNLTAPVSFGVSLLKCELAPLTVLKLPLKGVKWKVVDCFIEV